MGGVAKAVTSVVGGAIDVVGDAVEDVGDVVVDDIVKPIAKTVESTVKAAAEDPVGTMVKVAAYSTMNPAIIAAANAGVAVANGASFADAAKTAALSYAAGEIAQGVSAELKPEFADYVKSGDMTAGQAATAAKIAGNVAATTVTGGDPLQALVAGGVSAGTAAVTSDIPGFTEMSKAQQAAVNSAVSKTLQGRDPSKGLIDEAIVAGVSAAQSYSRAPSDDLMDQTSTTQEPAPAVGPGPAPSSELMNVVTPQENQQELIAAAPVPMSEETFTPTEQDQEDFYKSIGIDPTSLYDFPSMTSDPLSGMSTRGDYNEITGEFVYDPNGSMEGPLTNASGTNLSSMDGYTYDQNTRTWTSPDGTVTDLSYLESSGKPLDTHSLDYLNKNETDLGALARTLLNAVPAAAYGTGIALGANALFGEDSSKPEGYGDLTYDMGRQGVGYNQQAGSVNDGIAYGLDQLGTTFTKEAAQGGIMSLAQGGQVPSLGGYAAGGNPRLLRGPGDGMSDNIPATIAGKQPARLADGEFVIPADVVSHLGNGSTEAGANVLHQMMERVRKARTGNPKQGRQINPQKFVPRKGK